MGSGSFSQSMALAADHGLWLLIALVLGIVAGWFARRRVESRT